MIRRDSLLGAQESCVSSLLGTNIKVMADAKVPFADLVNRVLHIRPMPEEVDPCDLLHIRADVDHEMGHFAASNPNLLTSALEPMLKLVFNAIEDGYVERWVSDRWLGCAQNLSESNKQILAQIKATAVDSPTSRYSRAINALQSIAFGVSADKAIAMLGDDIKPLIDEISDLLPQVAAVQNTAMSLEAAREVVDRWRLRESERRSTQRESDSPVEETIEQIVRGLQREKTTADLRKQQIAGMEFNKGGQYRAWTDHDVVEVVRVTDEDRLYAEAFLNEVRSTVPTLRRRLLMEFCGRDYGTIHNQKTGDVDRSRLWEVPLGVETIFERDVEQTVVDADVTILIDASGSMTFGGVDGTRLHVAALTACALSTVLGMIGVRHECLAFTTSHDVGPMLPAFTAKRYERVRPLRHSIVKSFDEPWRACRERFVALSRMNSCAENIDGESVMWAAQRLAERNRPGMKPILLVLSDGDPASVPENAAVLNRHLHRVIDRVTRAGIKLVGIGIMTDAVTYFYEDSVVISALSDLAGVSYSVLRRALRSAVRRIA